MLEIYIKNEKEAEELGIQLADKLGPGSVIALTGNLGAGKTTFTKAVAKGLGITDLIVSPTFTIIQEYRSGRLPLYHFDVYRIEDEDELFELGYEEYIYGEGVCVIEWADRIADFLPDHTIHIHIAYGDGENERIFQIDENTSH
ncbi:MAG: tRNA (adenosine(37)-N6)-threonylcarbamoyltransferase complex ATPase subunit type 1 TsaE [Clostridiales bacterium]|jgi:tRNA threonylcarbamoyladenosine biosynthesis protein TsaE|nr:tRNA (adenosine(37)-N6)-threonylcarbamoyltransferase complex ATPase subunit type 1 TsaE [Clostridiales bacterium]